MQHNHSTRRVQVDGAILLDANWLQLFLGMPIQATHEGKMVQWYSGRVAAQCHQIL